ncbi:nucleoid-associated protein [Chryseobacterium sp. RP-3-3]|uniref:Nucleoid-associated protein n=1 Tax=Chryseobacterium antibioticum TaxID=2728847 RepID=A0A7Y0FU74_9FLAO|nr:nucleoid-associated protein [Chryseobacterium antibioticum]NML72451.1 nucleoid-associated protein [Chryseobacterium antibioticum]
MQTIKLGNIEKLIIHTIGNKNNEDGVNFSDSLTDFGSVEDIIRKLVEKNFKFEELYQFYFVPNLDLNPMYTFISSIFENNSDQNFVEQTKNSGRYLYDKSTHPQIKPGELYVFYMNQSILDGEEVDCVGIFKSETKETVLKVENEQSNYRLRDIHGMNIHKLDKGCLVFNTERKDGYLIAVVDNTNKSSEAQYWRDDFLSVRPKKNEYHQTNEFLSIAKQFVTKQLDEDFDLSRPDKIDMLNRSVDYFKKHETFDKQEFEEEVFANNGVIESFRKFDQIYRQENEMELPDSFEISAKAVKKQSRIFKNVLKLDKNFDIYIHGNRDLIEQGVDENGRKYYKIYYNEEN